MLAGRLDVAARLERRARSVRGGRGDGAAATRHDPCGRFADGDRHRGAGHDRPGLLWRVGQALGSCGLQVRAAQVDTLGAEAVDVFYVVDEEGLPLEDPAALAAVREEVLAALR